MRIWLALALGLGLSAAGAFAWGEAVAEPPVEERFQVPRLSRDVDPYALRGTHELILPADVIARADETPAEALSRALRGESAEPATKEVR